MRFRICFSVLLAVLAAVVFGHIMQTHGDLNSGRLGRSQRPDPDCVISRQSQKMATPTISVLKVSIFCTDGIVPVDSDFHLTCACPDNIGESCISEYMNVDGLPFIIFERPAACVDSIIDHEVGRQTIKILGVCSKEWACVAEAL